MKTQKTVVLPFTTLIDGKIHTLVEDPDFVRDYELDYQFPEMVYVPTKIQVGEEVVLFSRTNVSPNSIRAGTDKPSYGLLHISEAPEGIAGNSNRNIARFHGWRGTTNDVSVNAHGLRRVIRVRETENGVAVTVGPDLDPTEP